MGLSEYIHIVLGSFFGASSNTKRLFPVWRSRLSTTVFLAEGNIFFQSRNTSKRSMMSPKIIHMILFPYNDPKSKTNRGVLHASPLSNLFRLNAVY